MKGLIAMAVSILFLRSLTKGTAEASPAIIPDSPTSVGIGEGGTGAEAAFDISIS